MIFFQCRYCEHNQAVPYYLQGAHVPCDDCGHVNLVPVEYEQTIERKIDLKTLIQSSASRRRWQLLRHLLAAFIALLLLAAMMGVKLLVAR
jgi:hypothetical protein